MAMFITGKCTHTRTLKCTHTRYKKKGAIKVKDQVIMIKKKPFLRILNKFHMYAPNKIALKQMKKNWQINP